MRVFSFLSSALACCSLMMVALTWGGFMCTFSFPPTSSRTVAANLVCVFSTCGGCFSMMKVLRGHGAQRALPRRSHGRESAGRPRTPQGTREQPLLGRQSAGTGARGGQAGRHAAGAAARTPGTALPAGQGTGGLTW